jgi:hypothetical protein
MKDPLDVHPKCRRQARKSERRALKYVGFTTQALVHGSPTWGGRDRDRCSEKNVVNSIT